MDNLKPLERRPYRFKKAAIRFFCPLCRTERAISVSPRLTTRNYIQIVCAFTFFALVLFPFMEWNSFFLFFVIWIGMEASVRIRFKKEIPCPHCGFDATWYKRDVNVARRKVKDFWQEQTGEVPFETGEQNISAADSAFPNAMSSSQNESRLDSTTAF